LFDGSPEPVILSVSPARSDRQTAARCSYRLRERPQIALGAAIVIGVGLEAVDMLCPALRRRVAEAADMHADIDDDIVGSKRLGEAVLVMRVDRAKDIFVVRAFAEHK
jgi:hypothetical protein